MASPLFCFTTVTRAAAAAALVSSSPVYSVEQSSLRRAADLAVTCQLLDQLAAFDSYRSKSWFTSTSKYKTLRVVSKSLIWRKLPEVLACRGVQQRINSFEGPRRLVSLGRSADDRYLAYDIQNGRSGFVFGGTCIFKQTKRGWHLEGCTDTYVT